MCYIGDECDVWDERLFKARKSYCCDECQAPIPTGTRYIRIGSLFDGSWNTSRVHWECLVLWYSVHADLCNGEGLILIGGLEEELREFDHEHRRFGEDDEPTPTEAAPYLARLKAIQVTYTARFLIG